MTDSADTRHRVGATFTFITTRPDGTTFRNVARCIGGRHDPEKHQAIARAVARVLVESDPPATSLQDHRGSAAGVAAPSSPPLSGRAGVAPRPVPPARHLTAEVAQS